MASFAAPDKKEDAKDSKAEAKADGPKFDPVVPLNQPVKGLHLPYYNPDGSLKMKFDAAEAKRVDTDNIEMTKMRIETFDDKAKTEMVVDFPTARFNLTTNVISTKEKVTVKRADFQITGKGMEFDTKTKQGRLFSEIRMEIYDRSNLNQPTNNGQ